MVAVLDSGIDYLPPGSRSRASGRNPGEAWTSKAGERGRRRPRWAGGRLARMGLDRLRQRSAGRERTRHPRGGHDCSPGPERRGRGRRVLAWSPAAPAGHGRSGQRVDQRARGCVLVCGCARGARVANVSLGAPGFSRAEHDAIAAARDTLFVVAAGNQGSDNDRAGFLSLQLRAGQCVVRGSERPEGLARRLFQLRIEIGRPGRSRGRHPEHVARRWVGDAIGRLDGHRACDGRRVADAGPPAAPVDSVAQACPARCGRSEAAACKHHIHRGPPERVSRNRRGGPGAGRDHARCRPRQKSSVVARRGLQVRAACSSPASSTPRLRSTARPPGVCGSGPAAARSWSAPAGGCAHPRSAIVSLRLDSSARRRLMRVRSLGLSVTIRAVAVAGGTATRTERVVLSRGGG